jgi:methylmalonyl-CoA mutase cobalamin-binding subunit
MRDNGSGGDEGRGCSSVYVDLALEAIERLAAKRLVGVGVLRTAYLDRMLEVVVSHDPSPVEVMISEFRRAHIPSEQIADHYIPEAARRLGVDWLEDRASFAQVTIGAARLQDLLHAIQSDWTADSSDPVNQSAVLMIVPPAEQHTLGAMVAASMLRRRGISVCIRIAPGLSDLAALMANRRFDAAFVSVGGTDKVEMCVKLVKTLSQLGSGGLRIAVGGCVNDACEGPLSEVGADMVTNDVSAVVAAFGLVGREKTLTV